MAKATARATQAVNPAIEACEELFGEHPEDVIDPINSAANALMWLEEILATIAHEALSERGDEYRIKHLAEAGVHIARDIGGFAGRQHETMIARLRDAGVVPVEGGAA